MRNLKRVLSLALATAMLFSMMVIGASAASKKASDLTDMDKVSHKEAVSLMVDLGIIVGKPDGSFAPTETVDRATMSKLIYFILMGTADETAFKGVPTPLTDVKGNWAEGFINYCYSMKIVAGTGNNTYNPNGKVTTASAAKMLLVALGYDAKLSKYENDAMWSVNIMRDAQKAGLLENVNQKASENLTRDNAAQMIYNALFAKTVTPIVDRDMGVAYLSKNEEHATTLGQETYNLFKGTAVVDGIDTDGTIMTSLTSGVAYKADLEKMTATSEMLGNSVNVYYKSAYTVVGGAVVLGTYDKMVSSVAFPAASKIVSSTNDGTKLADLTKKGDKKYVGDLDASVEYFLNGASITPGSVSAFDTSYAKAGIIVELINNDNDAAIDVVKVTQKTVRTLTGNAETKTVSGADTQVKVPGVINAFSSTNTVKNVVGYEGLKKDDVVLTYTFGTITYIEKAASIEGTVAARNSAGKLSVGGTYYGGSGLNGFDTTTVDFENTYVFYLDNSGSIVKAEKKTDNASSNYVFVAEQGWKPAVGGVGGAKGYAEARILNNDGTSQIVTVSKLADKAIVDSVVNASKEVLYTSTLLTGAFYTYKTDSNGKYELTLATAKSGITSANAAQAGITGNTAKFDNTNIANSSTVFLVKSGTADAPVYKAYVGIANLPSMTLDTTAPATLATQSELIIKSGVVTHAFLDVTGGILTGEVGEYFYVIANSAGGVDYVTVPKAGDVPQHNTVKAIVNGESVTAKIADVLDVDGSGADLSANVMYKVTSKDANGIIDTLAPVATGTAAGDVRTGVKLAGDTLIAGTSTQEVVTVSSSTDVFYITKDGVSTINYADIQSDKTDKVMIAKKDSKGHAEIVYVIDVIETSAAADTITYKVDGAATTTPSITWTTTGGRDGSTIAKAKQYTLTVASVAIAKDFELALNAVSAEADVALVSGTVPAKTAATGATLSDVLVYQVTAEDGTTICYYEITLAVTSA